MCLPMAVRDPSVVEAKGEYQGFEWMVVHNRIAYRCGYVKVSPGHPWHGKRYGDIDAEVHGGLTFSENDEPCDAEGPDDGWWVGFDCAHGGDAPDPTLPGYREEWADHGGYDRVRSTAYVEHECKNLCEQAAAAVA